MWLSKNATTFAFRSDLDICRPCHSGALLSPAELCSSHPKTPRSSRQIPSKAPSHRPMSRLKRWVAPCTWSRKSKYGQYGLSTGCHTTEKVQDVSFFAGSRSAILQLHGSGCQIFNVEKPSKGPCTVAWTHPLDLRLLEP